MCLRNSEEGVGLQQRDGVESKAETRPGGGHILATMEEGPGSLRRLRLFL